MGQGYTRNDTGNNISDGNVINASDLDGEFDAIVSAFNSSSGHTHDGTAAEGAPITKFGPSQEVEGDASALFPASDGVTDLGKSTKEWKDLYIDGVINTDNMSADAATITGNTSVGGTFNVGEATTLSNTLAVSATSAFKGAVSVESTLAVTGETNVSDISASGTLDVGGNGSVGGTLNISGAVDTESTMSVQSNASVGGTLAVTGDTDVSNLSASGTLDVAGNASIGGTFQVTGEFNLTDVSASGTLDVAGNGSVGGTLVVTGDTDITNVSANGTLDVSGNASVGGTLVVTGDTDVTNLSVGGTFNVEGDLKNSAGNLTIAATSYIVEVKGGGSTDGQIQLNCRDNSHGQKVIAQPHSEGITNEMLLPKGANSTLVSEVGTATITNKTLDSVVSVSAAGAVNVGTTLAVLGDTDVTNLSANGTLDVSGNGSVGGSFTVNTTITSGSSVSDSKGDLRTVPKAAIYANDYTLSASNAGQYVVLNSSGVSLTIPSSTFGEGDVITVISTDGATASISSNITSFIAAGVSATATMTLEANGVANILFTSASFAILTGNIS